MDILLLSNVERCGMTRWKVLLLKEDRRSKWKQRLLQLKAYSL
jgi:hypothetical protein